MNEKLLESLRQVQILSGLSDQELVQFGRCCKVRQMAADQVIFHEGDEGNELFIIHEGCVRISINALVAENTMAPTTINMLYTGQSFGEMVLMGGANRSATVTSVEPCFFLVIQEHDFANLCEANPRIGYCVMRNLAADLIYKLRSSNLLLRGNIRWRGDELSRRSK
jgi:CRP-like cAMP-binding protein